MTKDTVRSKNLFSYKKVVQLKNNMAPKPKANLPLLLESFRKQPQIALPLKYSNFYM